jgi:hypothetical protein
MHVVTVAALASEAGRAKAQGIADWADGALDSLHGIFHEAPDGVSDLAVPLGLLLTELACAISATLDSVKEASWIITGDVVDQHNRAAALQRAALMLMNHLQRHCQTELATVVPPPESQLGHECVCDKDEHEHAPARPLLN